MRIIVVGAGEIGKTLINMLTHEKHEVVLIDQNVELVKEIANQIDILVIKGDATQMTILKDAGIEKADALVSVTNDDKTNLMVSEIALSASVRKVIARVNTPGNEELFTKIGVNTLIPSVGLVVAEIKNALMSDPSSTNDQKSRLIWQLGKGEVEIYEVVVGKESKVIGKEITAAVPNGIISCLYRNGELIVPMSNRYAINAGDVLLITSKAKDQGDIIKLINPSL